MRPEFTDPYAAARVSSFMDEGALGRWQVTRFTVDDLKARRSMARHIADSHSSEEAEMRLARNVPPGDYVSLRRRAVPEELPDVEQEVVYEDGSAFDGWVPIMSDTPSEIHEHDEAIENAHGRVLITGLGLGVLVSALLAKPEVEHITVVEIDRDVIGLTGHYYSNHPKVRLVNADALPSPGTCWPMAACCLATSVTTTPGTTSGRTSASATSMTRWPSTASATA
jgi:hypothetical protein